MANAALFSIIPKQAILLEGAVMLNPADPVVSGALMLGVYEKFETELMRKILKPGMTVLDVGANVGYYTAIAAYRVGNHGRVIAFEPDPVNFSFLNATIKANAFQNVSAHQAALGDRNDETTLFKSPSNMGDHRMYAFPESTETITVPLMTLDDFVKSQGLQKIDVIKMDIQGAEGQALRGMMNALGAQKSVTLITEFWPKGLKAAGTDPRWFLETLHDLNFSIMHIDEASFTVRNISDFQAFINSLPGRKYTNLICEKKQ